MGIVRMGPPEPLVLKLQSLLKVHIFVETGTYMGATAAWAAPHFRSVFTIEASKALYQSAKLNLARFPNVEVLCASSPTGLRDLAARLDGPAIFWLDAHWSGGATAGAESQCPLIEEIRALSLFDSGSVVFIDDARLLLSTPQPPHDPDQWPTISAIIKELDGLYPTHHTVILDDVLICVPRPAAALLKGYASQVNKLAGNVYSNKVSDLRPAAHRMIETIKSLLHRFKCS